MLATPDQQVTLTHPDTAMPASWHSRISGLLKLAVIGHSFERRKERRPIEHRSPHR